MLQKCLLFIISSFVFNFCTSSGQNINQEFVKARQKFDSRFTDHFPSTLPFISTFQLTEDKIISHPGLWAKGQFDREVIDSLEKIVPKIAVAKYSAKDSCLLLIDEHLNVKNWVNFEKSLDEPPEPVSEYPFCSRDKLPIPKFWSEGWVETRNTKVQLDPQYKLYVLDAKPGIFLDESDLPNGKFTPEGWEHGYSKGIAINDESCTVIFWFDIW